MIVYFDSSALVKRYVREQGTPEVVAAMREARAWVSCRLGYVETARVVGRIAAHDGFEEFRADWPSFSVIELDLRLAEDAAELAIATGLRSLDAIHLAAALSLAVRDLTFATWDVRLHQAARERGLTLLPESLA